MSDNNNEEPLYVGAKELCNKYIKISPRTLSGLKKDGKIPFLRVVTNPAKPRGRILYNPKGVAKALENLDNHKQMEQMELPFDEFK